MISPKYLRYVCREAKVVDVVAPRSTVVPCVLQTLHGFQGGQVLRD